MTATDKDTSGLERGPEQPLRVDVGRQGARDETGRQQDDDRRDAQPACQHLGADREYDDKANANQDLVCRHASLRWSRVGFLFARRSLCGGQHPGLHAAANA
jgi:hypothetical protein